ncbi:MAG TPA: hypothetical protein VN368_02210 [Candidatus Methylomirabilis sp.]|nr:hypothetical protein [Candidatus Methylomirabilis sp.]
MSKVNNVLVDLRVGIAGKKPLVDTVIEKGDDIASKSDKAFKFNIPTITNPS